jgi:hypothetical protein
MSTGTHQPMSVAQVCNREGASDGDSDGSEWLDLLWNSKYGSVGIGVGVGAEVVGLTLSTPASGTEMGSVWVERTLSAVNQRTNGANRQKENKVNRGKAKNGMQARHAEKKKKMKKPKTNTAIDTRW